MATFHSFLIGLSHQAVQWLPGAVRSALDAWSQRVARERALQRQRACRRAD